MSLVLQNPRDYVTFASITELKSNTVFYLLRYETKYSTGDSRTYITKTIGAAKAYFAKHVLEKKYHGENIWKEETQ